LPIWRLEWGWEAGFDSGQRREQHGERVDRQWERDVRGGGELRHGQQRSISGGGGRFERGWASGCNGGQLQRQPGERVPEQWGWDISGGGELRCERESILGGDRRVQRRWAP